MKLVASYEKLLEIFQRINTYSRQDLYEVICQLDIELHLREALLEAINGDNRKMNTWLFTQESSLQKPLFWIAPVINNGEESFVWMYGFHNPLSSEVFKLFSQAQQSTATDDALQQKKVPPPLLLVDPSAISNAAGRDGLGEDEFSIFQIGYIDTPSEIGDFEQRMIINASHAINRRRIAVQRLKRVLGKGSEVLVSLEEELDLFSLLHTEGHNQGHFVGVWPHEDTIKKKCVLYEAVEEFRACLASILIVNAMPLSSMQKNAYALGVFATRFFGFGYDAFTLTEHRRETVREITVGLMFFEWLCEAGVVQLNQYEDVLSVEIDFYSLNAALCEAFNTINQAEASIGDTSDASGLRAIAESWYGRAFPNGDYSHEARMVYNSIAFSTAR